MREHVGGLIVGPVVNLLPISVIAIIVLLHLPRPIYILYFLWTISCIMVADICCRKRNIGPQFIVPNRPYVGPNIEQPRSYANLRRPNVLLHCVKC